MVEHFAARLNKVEQRLDELEKQLAVLNAAVSLARWMGPLLVGLAAVVIGRLG